MRERHRLLTDLNLIKDIAGRRMRISNSKSSFPEITSAEEVVDGVLPFIFSQTNKRGFTHSSSNSYLIYWFKKLFPISYFPIKIIIELFVKRQIYPVRLYKSKELNLGNSIN